MPSVLGQNSDGTWKIQRDDGMEVDTAYLPAGLSGPTAAPASAPSPMGPGADMSSWRAGGSVPTQAPAAAPEPEKLLHYRGEDKFDRAVLHPNGSEMDVVTTPTALQSQNEGGFRVVTNEDWNRAMVPVQQREAERNAQNRPPGSGGSSTPMGALKSAAMGAMPAGPASPEGVARGVAAQGQKQAEVDELMRLSDPGGPTPVQQLVNSTGLGIGPAVPRPAPAGPPREFNGWMGDPGVVRRTTNGQGYELGGTSNATGHEARSDIGGNAPPVQQPVKPLAAGDFPSTTPPASAPSVTSASSSVRFAPAGPSRGERELNDAFAEQRKALAARAALEEQQAAAEQARLDAQLAADRKRQEDEAQRAAFRQKAQEDAEGELRSAIDKLSTPSGELDPSRWWESRSTGQKIAAYASAFLTGFGGGPNVIQQAIDADIAAQRYNLDRQDKANAQAVEGKKLLLGTMRERFQDEILADAAARAAATEYARKEAERETAGFKGQAAQVKRQELLGVLDQQAAEAKAVMRDRAAQLGMKQAEFALQVQAMQQAQQQTRAAQVAEAGEPVPVASLTKDQRERAVMLPGGQLAALALDKEAAKKAREVTTTHNATDDALRQLIALRQEYGGEVLPTEAKAKMKSLKEDVILRMKDSLKLGVMSDSDYALMERLIGGDPTSVFSPNALPTLEDLRRRGQTNYLNEMQQYGVNPVPRYFTERQAPKR